MDITVQKKEPVKPTKPGPKKPESKPTGNAQEGRTRSKTTMAMNFEPKKGAANKKESKPVETIGGEKFKNLLSMFDKKPEAKENTVTGAVGKLDMNRFSGTFGGVNNNNISGGNQYEQLAGGMAQSIKDRMNALLDKGRAKSVLNPGPSFDPVLQNRKNNDDIVHEDENEGDLGLGDDDDLHISEDEGDNKSEKSDDDLGSDKEDIKEDKEDNKEDIKDDITDDIKADIKDDVKDDIKQVKEDINEPIKEDNTEHIKKEDIIEEKQNLIDHEIKEEKDDITKEVKEDISENKNIENIDTLEKNELIQSAQETNENKIDNEI
jgi:hypothetical protein